MSASGDCYASILGGCAGGASREHYFSESILKLFSGGKAVQVGGFTWLADGEEKWVGTGALTAKVLCRNHNFELSDLDGAALALFQAWDQMYTAFADPTNPLALAVQIDGPLLERWMLKALCGCIAAKIVPLPETVRPDWQIPEEWIQVLYGHTPMSPDCGLYIFHDPGDQIDLEWSIGIEPFGKDGELVGVCLTLNRMRFVLFMSPPDLPGEKREQLIYRPEGVLFHDGASKIALDFGWVGRGVLTAEYLPDGPTEAVGDSDGPNV